MPFFRSIVIAGVTTTALVSVGIGTAHADPATIPGLDTIVGVGSGTTSPLFDSFARDYNATNPQYPLATWDSTDSYGDYFSTITAKASGSADDSCSLQRPAGPSDGVLWSSSGVGQSVHGGIFALNQNQTDASKDSNGQTVHCIDFAQSDRGPNTPTSSNPTVDTFVALAADEMDWSYPVVSGESNPQPAMLTVYQLQQIYSCQVTNWDQVGGADAPIGVVVPQPSSGTWTTWLAAMGISPGTRELCWFPNTNGNNVIEDNTGLSAGNVAQFTTTDNGIPPQDDIFPYSIADWIAQSSPVTGSGPAGTPTGATVGGHATSTWGHGNLQLGEVVDDFDDTDEPVITNSDGQPVINPNWAFEFDYSLYAVTRNGGTATSPALPTTPAYEAKGLTDLFGPNGWFCASNTAQSGVVSYGFGTPTAGCGALAAGN